jgi:hypothetical protein
MPQNFQPPWDFNPAQVPPEWFIHAINLQRMPTGAASEDDAGGRTAASDPGFTVLATNVHCLVILDKSAQKGPETSDVRLVTARWYTIFTDVDMTVLGVRRGDIAIYGSRNLSIQTVENVEEMSTLWKIKAVEYT